MFIFRHFIKNDKFISHLELAELIKSPGAYFWIANKLRIVHNRSFTKKQSQRLSDFFKTVESYPLDKQQIEAVLADEDNCLVIAGAGSGKTSTIVAKIKYLITVLNVPVEEILTISFTNKSAADLKRRINVPGLTPQTFHKLGLTVHTAVNQTRPNIYDGRDNCGRLSSYLTAATENQAYLGQLAIFLKSCLKIPKSRQDFSSRIEYKRYVKEFRDSISEDVDVESLVIEKLDANQIAEFLDLCRNFLSLFKADGLEIGHVKSLLNENKLDKLQTLRINIFLELFKPIYEKYRLQLRADSMIDFNDMILQAINYIDAGLFRKKYSYIIIDEFQDLSIGRYRLLQAIRRQNPAVKFFCVGDDWQSIFRFAGSDINLFKSFNKYFGYSHKARIETTYRFSQPLIKMSSSFILRNPSQTFKALKTADKSKITSYSIIETKAASGDDTEAVLKALQSMRQLGLCNDSKVYIIGRYNFDFGRITVRRGVIEPDPAELTFRYYSQAGGSKPLELTIEFVTAHKSKGLEADFVLIINCNSGKYGFPSDRVNDPTINLLLSSTDKFEDSEERRLFYVAMTRAKRHVVFIAEADRKSRFIKELQKDHLGKKTACPKCGDGEVIKHKAKYGILWSCTNYAYGCTYTSS